MNWVWSEQNTAMHHELGITFNLEIYSSFMIFLRENTRENISQFPTKGVCEVSAAE